jgi:hypothetical protein
MYHEVPLWLRQRCGKDLNGGDGAPARTRPTRTGPDLALEPLKSFWCGGGRG